MACDLLGPVATGNDAKSKLEILARLRNHISEIQKRCKLLEEELAIQNRHVGSIHAMPPEILSIVFGFYVKEKPRHIRRLMLVCKQWCHVALNNPQLWTSIRIEACEYVGYFQYGVERLRPFIQACVQRSGIALLHIDLDFNYISPWDQHVESELISTLSNLFPGGEDVIDQWVQEQDWSWCMEDRGVNPPGHHSYLLGFLHDLGPKIRWGSLKLAFPADTELAGEILAILAGDTPNLTSLSISEYPSDFIEEHDMRFSNLSNLKILKVSDIETLQFLEPPSSLDTLEVGTNLYGPDMETLNRLTGLRTLTIFQSYNHVSPLTNGSTSLNLSKLRNLHLMYPSSHTAQIKYKLPALQDLFLTDQSDDFFDHPLNVLPVHIHWKLRWAPEAKLLSVAEKVLTQYPRAKCMTTDAGAKGAVLEVVTRLKRAGKLNAELDTLMFEKASGVVDEIIRVDDI